jgi:nitrite reductase/ring-hydroxylating ferredoxin subunit
MTAQTSAQDGCWVEAIQADSLPVDDATRIEHDGTCIAIFNLGGKFYATSGICTHAHAFLSEGYIDGQTVECPLHQGLFHIPTGTPMSPPVTERLKTYETKVEGGYVYVLVGEAANKT